MGRPNRLFRKGEIITVSIETYAFGGKGIARIPTEKGDFTVFVQNSFPGQKVSARVVKCKNSYAECKLEEVIERSPEENDIPYQPIPGAPYATLPIDIQHKYKRETTLDLFRRIGNIENIEDLLDEFISSPKEWHYRNKMEYSFSQIRHDLPKNETIDDFALGFKHRGTWWVVENLDNDSGLFDAEFESKLHQLRIYLENTGCPAWHPPKRIGFFRFLVARKSLNNNQLLLNLVTTSSHLEQFDLPAFIEFTRSLFGERLAGIMHTVNDDTGDRVEPRQGSPSLIFGQPFIREKVLGLEFDISMGSFFQTNPESAELLYQKAIDYVDLDKNNDGIILDLFCGTGTITQILAKATDRRVIGVDIVEKAIADAKSSAVLNKVDNAEFVAADVGKFLLDYPEFSGKIGTVVLDPPRSGISPKSLRKVIRLNAARIVYISCNPSTQARDTQTLAEHGYSLKKFSICDQFPHTSHIESVALYERQ
jgi:23S rRNA (uracil-5-)-methyltransferase RumA